MTYQLRLSLLLVMLFFSGQSLFAQYDGGTGDGNDKSGVIQSTLKGLQFNDFPLFQGGAGDGADKFLFVGVLNGTDISVLFSGGEGDGFDKEQFNGSIDGTSVTGLYSGGEGDGFDKEQFNGTIDGTSISGLYSGGEGDGFDKEQFNGILDGTSIIGLYSGGEGDGFDKEQFNGIIDGTDIAILYGGGIGDGFDKEQFNGIIDGTDIAILYGGGIGDGFDKAAYSGILTIALPIELIVFDAFPEHKHVVVFWITANEIDNDFFTVQRTKDFTAVESIGDINTQGNLNGEQNYEFLDLDPFSGLSYYRLKSTALNGEVEFSDWVDVRFEGISTLGDVTLYPNPTSAESVNLRLESFDAEWDISVKITSMDGKLIYLKEQLDLSGNQDEFILQLGRDLAAGLYVVSIYGDYNKSVLLMKAK
ncbi:MAG: T9SS type A sorting domain-containing protein [Bacteroidota bacterium]